MATAWTLARVLLLTYLGWLAFLFVVQRRVAFPGTHRAPPRSTPVAPASAEQLWLDTSFGRVEAWLIAAPARAAAPTAIYGHGNGELIDDWGSAMAALAAEGVNVLLVEFPGYGYSDGAPSRASIAETFEAAFDRLVARDDIDSTKIFAYGRSLGGGAAADLTRSRPIAALVLQSTFSSAAAMARGAALVPAFAVRDRFDNEVAVRETDVPLLVLHGRADEVIPFAHAERLAAARDGLSVVEIACGHNDCGRIWPQIVSEIERFLERQGLLER
jgi:uncharacterized protein